MDEIRVNTKVTQDGMKYSISKTFKENIRDIAKNKYIGSSYNALKVSDNTPNILKNLGLNDYPVLMTLSHAKNALGIGTGKNQHLLDVSVLENIDKLIENPIAIYEKNGNLNALLRATDKKNNIIEIAIKPNGKGYYNNIEIDSNFLLTAFGKENIIRYYENIIDKTKILYPANAQKNQLISEIIRYQSSNHSTISGKYSISDNNENVNIQHRDIETDNIIKGVRKEFGVTNNANEVGYIDLDGKFIDFSGKQFSGQSNVRLMDHSDLYLDDMDVDYNKYMELGNIRAFPETGGFELITKPNKEQEIALLKYLKTNLFAQNEGSFVGISSPNKIGEYDIASLQFEQDTKPQDILNEALSYFTDNAKFSINNTTVKNRLKPSSYYDYDNLVKMNDIIVPNITTHNYSKVSVRDLIDLSRNNAQNYCAILDNQSGSYFIKDIDNNTIRVNYAGLTHTKSNIKGLLDNDRRNLIVNFGEIFNNSIKTNEAYRNDKHSGIYNGVYGSGNDTFVARFIIVYGSLESSNISKLYAAASKKK